MSEESSKTPDTYLTSYTLHLTPYTSQHNMSTDSNRISFCRTNDAARLPTRATEGSAGMDLFLSENIRVEANSRQLASTGLLLQSCPSCCYLRIAPRSGKSLQGIDIGGGVVDSDYRGHIGIILVNHTNEPIVFEKGERVAQLIPTLILPNVSVQWSTDNNHEEDTTDRGTRGFGSTGDF